MGRINSRVKGLAEAFSDGDLLMPSHDKIALWLNDWLKKPENIRQLIGPVHPYLYESTVNVLDDFSLEDIDMHSHDRPDVVQQLILDAFKRQHPSPAATRRKTPFGNAPQRHLRFQSIAWETWLYDGEYGSRKTRIGAPDLECRYEIGCHLTFVTKNTYRLVEATPKEQGYGYRFSFEQVKQDHEWSEDNEDVRLLFEVKSEIRSIGELLRQLQLYRSTDSFSLRRDQLIVVSPRHDEAERICRENGFGFLRFPQP